MQDKFKNNPDNKMSDMLYKWITPTLLKKFILIFKVYIISWNKL